MAGEGREVGLWPEGCLRFSQALFRSITAHAGAGRSVLLPECNLLSCRSEAAAILPARSTIQSLTCISGGAGAVIFKGTSRRRLRQRRLGARRRRMEGAWY